MLLRSLRLLVCAASLYGQDTSPNILVDQVGYLPNAPKFALYTGSSSAVSFQVLRASDDKQVFTGPTSAGSLDFSSLREPGEYYVAVPEVGRSYKFRIAPDVYQRAYYLAMRSYYGQRCGMAVDLGSEFPGYRYDACHSRGAWHPSSGKEGERPSIKGWHDAGDYGRYVVNSGVTSGTLLWAYELYKPRVGLKIPESGNGTPDILNEVRWNLDWMLTMQDSDGGVWHKQTSAKFAGFVMPQRDESVSIVVSKSTCATADLAGVMAIAARVYKPFDAPFAGQALQAAEKAFAWAEANPSVTFRNPAGVSTGEYGDRNCSDERLWAAAELWRTTGKAVYNEAFLSRYKAFLGALTLGNLPGWPNLAHFGLWTYAMATQADAEARAAIREATVLMGRAIAERTLSSPYRMSMGPHDYIWGSNSVALNYSLTLLIADQFDGSRGFRDAALENLHYIFGRNAFSVSWVTWTGTNWFKHPHHRPSAADGITEPWPGLLSGGPNKNRQDDAMRKMPAGLSPMQSWIDSQDSYASNEVAINWNAPLVFVLAASLR